MQKTPDLELKNQPVSTRHQLSLLLPTLLASCVAHYEIGNNPKLAEQHFAARACDESGPLGNIRSYRFGFEGDLPECDDPVKLRGYHGVSSDGLNWGLFAYYLSPEARKTFKAYDLAGHGKSEALGLSGNDINPLTIAWGLRDEIRNVTESPQDLTFIGHSAGSAVATFLANEAPGSKLVVFNPVLIPDNDYIRTISRIAPVACNLKAAPYLVRRGTIAENEKKSGRGFGALKDEKVAMTAKETNICLNIFDEDGMMIGNSGPCDNTPIQRLADAFEENCEYVTGYINSVRKPRELNKWGPQQESALRVRDKNRWSTHVFLSKDDDVLNPDKIKDALKAAYPSFNVKYIGAGGHEIISTKPGISAELASSPRGGRWNSESQSLAQVE